MSFVHASIVGHFDPSDLESVHARRGPVPVRPIDRSRAGDLLAAFGLDVAGYVVFEHGYVWCEWSSDRSGRVREFAERLADQEGAVIIESPPAHVRYPPAAVKQFEEAIDAWAAARRDD